MGTCLYLWTQTCILKNMSKTSKSIEKMGQSDKGLCVPYVQYVCVQYILIEVQFISLSRKCVPII